MLTLGGSTPSVVVVLGIVAIIISAIQAVLMLFRQGALVVLAGVLPLAAAGTLTPATRRWFPRVTGWMLALIFYKPAAAAVYATAFTMIGTGKDPRTVLMGFAMVFLSLLALPVLMRLFTWTTGHVADASGGGGFLQTALQGAVAVGALRGDVRRVGRLRPGRAGPHGLRPARPRRFRAGRGAAARRRSPARQPPRPLPARPRAQRQAPPQRPPPPGQARRPVPRPPARAPGRRCRQRCRPGRDRRGRARGGRGQRPPQGNRGHAAARHPRRRPVSYHDTDTPRDYGGWRRRRGIGLFGFGAAGTAAVLGALLVLIITATADAAALLYLAPPGPAGRRRSAWPGSAGSRWRWPRCGGSAGSTARRGTGPATGPRWWPSIPRRSRCPGCWRR